MFIFTQLINILNDLKKFGGKFALVGIVATVVHFYVFVLLDKVMWPEIANFFSFLASFLFSFFGHRYLTFNSGNSPLLQSIIRFFSAACLGFLNNELILIILHRVFSVDAKFALICGMVTSSAQTFLLSKYWAFKE